MVAAAPIIAGYAIVLTVQIPYVSIVSFLHFNIFSAYFLITFQSPGIAILININIIIIINFNWLTRGGSNAVYIYTQTVNRMLRTEQRYIKIKIGN
jgi:hypothetical protein